MLKKIKAGIKNPKEAIKYIAEICKILQSSKVEDIFEIDQNDLAAKKKLAICFGFPPWKHEYMRKYLPNYCLAFTRNRVPIFKVILTLKQTNIPFDVFIWSYLEPDPIYTYLKKNNIKIRRVEDGFIRSAGLGADRTVPLSLAIDNDSIYFNPRVTSRLEQIIFTKAKKYTNEQIKDAQKLIEIILKNKISKYNFPISNGNKVNLLIDKAKKTILVIGQVEDDMSIKLGFDGKVDNLELVKLAYNENPDCNIIFKVHPDIFKGKRNNKTSIDEYTKYSIIAPLDASLHELIDVSNHIYTITSLSGFEALLRKKKVTCLGMPFYSNWGLTDDRQIIARRHGVDLTLEQLFYAAYIEYPKYLNNSLEKTIQDITKQVMHNIKVKTL